MAQSEEHIYKDGIKYCFQVVFAQRVQVKKL